MMRHGRLTGSHEHWTPAAYTAVNRFWEEITDGDEREFVRAFDEHVLSGARD